MRNFLIDTHVLLWFLFNPDQLSESTKNILVDSDNEVYVSSVTFWEISLKYILIAILTN